MRSAKLLSLLSLLALVSAVAPTAARSHDLWLEPEGDHLVLRSGHRGGRLLALDASRVRSVLCLRGAGPAMDVRAASQVGPKELRTPGGCDAASATLDAGYRSLTPDGVKALPRTQVPDAVRSWLSRQFAKWVDARSPGAAAVLGAELEIVPVTPLATVRRGSEATFRVLWQGKPVAGARCAVDHGPSTGTDAAGECRLKVHASDVESVSVLLKRPLGTPEADTLSAEASLTFQVAR